MNSKVYKVFVWIFSILLIAAIGFAVYFYFVNANRAQDEKDKENKAWQTYTSTVYGYQVQFPQDWFLVTEGPEPVFEKSVVFSTHQDYETETAHTNLGVTVLDDLSEIDSLREVPYVETTAKVAKKDAIQLNNWDDLKRMVVATYVEKGDRVFRLSMGPIQESKQTETQESYEKFLKNFKFIDIESKSRPEVVHAASYVLDQYYAPSNHIHLEAIPTAMKQVGQTFKPTYNNVAKVEVKIRVPSSCNVTLRLTNASNDVLSEKAATVVAGWNTYILNSPVVVTPDAEYRIWLHESGGCVEGIAEWYAGQQPHDNGNTYKRGHAWMGGFAEEDIDFHFKEYALVEDVTPEPDKPTTTKPGASKEEESEEAGTDEVCNLEAPTNLDFDLRIVGITETYIDFEWDKITDECLGGYKLYYGKETGQYTKIINAGKKNKVRIKNLNPTRTYYFVVRAYDIYGKQSSASNEVAGKLLLESFWKWLWIFLPLVVLLILSIILFVSKRKKEKNQKEKVSPPVPAEHVTSPQAKPQI